MLRRLEGPDLHMLKVIDRLDPAMAERLAAEEALAVKAKWSATINVPFGQIWLRNLKKCQFMQCFRIPFKPYCSKMAKRDTYSNTTLLSPNGFCSSVYFRSRSINFFLCSFTFPCAISLR